MKLRVVLGVLYVAMAVGQGLSWSAMPTILERYQAAPTPALPSLAGAVIIAELVGGLWLLLRTRSTDLGPVWLYTIVALLWTVLSVQAFARGLTIPNCGCFGSYLPQRLSWFTLSQDALLLAYAWFMVRTSRRAGAQSHAFADARPRKFDIPIAPAAREPQRARRPARQGTISSVPIGDWDVRLTDGER